MNALLFIFLFCLMGFSCSEYNPKEKKVVFRSYFVGDLKNSKKLIHESFFEKDSLLKEVDYEDNMVNTTIYRRGPLNNLMEKVYTKLRSGKTIEKTVTYYMNNRPRTRISYNADGQIIGTVEYLYDVKGILIKKANTGYGDSSWRQMEGDNIIVPTNKADSTIYNKKYDDKGRLIEEFETTKEVGSSWGMVGSSYKYSYDENNRISARDSEYDVTYYTYDGLGNIISKKKYFKFDDGEKLSWELKFQYNTEDKLSSYTDITYTRYSSIVDTTIKREIYRYDGILLAEVEYFKDGILHYKDNHEYY